MQGKACVQVGRHGVHKVMTITLTREEAHQVLGALEDVTDGAEEPHKTKEAIETLRARLAQQACSRCGKVNPAEIHTCTPIDPLLEALRVPDYSKAGFASPQREWVGLTDEEVDEATKERWVAKQSFEAGAWWANEKIKEKNT
jgi:hypothetical protein